jgi:hypothetical protein
MPRLLALKIMVLRQWRKLNIAGFLKLFGWFGVSAAVVGLGVAFYAAFWTAPTETSFFGRINEALSLASLIPNALLLALGGLLLSRARELEDAQEKRSLFYLESCVRAYEEAWNLLCDGNNDRGTWIAAARALKHAQKLAERVTMDAHLRVLELHQLKYRGRFDQILRDKPATFFYGARDTSIALEAAAAASTAPEERAGRTVTSTAKMLAERSLYAVWEAAQWPRDYRDPLDREFSSKEEGSLLVLYSGLHDYLEHTRQYHSASGKLFPREQNDGSKTKTGE